ncbi:MAG: hypothetical protein GXY83_07575 [Rhodopirellula sp.]|nr:hypothetical protein [Rhodopirellula sp.]
MTRAGREPAEDVKRRLVAACQEVGLTVASARMHLIKSAKARLVHVEANVTGWSHDIPTLSILAMVKQTGDWPESVDIRCIGSNENPTTLTGPWMKGRSAVPFGELIEQLQETLKERDVVIAATESGVAGPYRFERSVWEHVDLLGYL